MNLEELIRLNQLFKHGIIYYKLHINLIYKIIRK